MTAMVKLQWKDNELTLIILMNGKQSVRGCFFWFGIVFASCGRRNMRISKLTPSDPCFNIGIS